MKNPYPKPNSAKIPLTLGAGLQNLPEIFVGSFVGKRGSQNPQVID
jgi:hypothetical protein